MFFGLFDVTSTSSDPEIVNFDRIDRETTLRTFRINCTVIRGPRSETNDDRQI